ncbi:MAG: hypothetical protein BWY23_02465 [Spirochaetes bacterium ADurb.Bin218]|nr:MAG: hypothetical protein BWY23_02465 [Spirochaetes bacterium ADurb.Bin218]
MAGIIYKIKNIFKRSKNSKDTEVIEIKETTSETQQEEVKQRPLYLKILIQVIKTLLVRIPLGLIILIAIVLLVAKIYLSPQRVENLSKKIFSSLSYGTLDLKVEKFSPYSGFIISDIVIKSGPDFNEEKLFEIKKLVLEYSFFKIFTGSIRFPEIGIYNPTLYLKEKDGIWNVSALMKPSEKSETEEKKEKPKEESQKAEEIKLPIAIDLLLNFILEDLCLFIESKDFTTELTGLKFKASIEIPPFKRIPLSPEAVKILRTMRIELNPEDKMTINFFSRQAETKPELILNWNLIFNNGEKSEFSSTFNAGAKKMPLRLQKKIFSPFSFLISYDLFYNPISDILNINNLSISFQDNDWIKIAGSIEDVTKSQRLNINLIKSKIVLSDLYPYYVTMTDDKSKKWSGEISLAPLSIKGTARSPEIKGSITCKDIAFKQTGLEARIPSIELNYFAIQQNSSMQTGADLSIPHLQYVIDGSKSGDNGLKLSARADGVNNFSTIYIKGLSLDFYNPTDNKKALSINLVGSINSSNGTSGSVTIDKLKFNPEPLSKMVPGRFKEQVTSLPIQKGVDVNISSNFTLAKEKTSANLSLGSKIPDYNINDLSLFVSVEQDNIKKRISINNLSLGSKAMNLALGVKGDVELKKAPLSDSNIDLYLELNNPVKKQIFAPWESSGMIKLSANMKGDLATGKIKGNLIFNNFNISNKESMLAVQDMNMNFPFEYKFELIKDKKSYIAVTQKQIIDSDFFREKPNFSIKSIASKHPARNMQYEYMKDFSTFMEFKDNVFVIRELKASVMDGTIYGKSILFNLADLKPENMEFALILDVSNINIARLDDPYGKKTTKNSELSLNANFSGKGLDITKELSASGYINIYKIGEDFANKLMRGLSEEKGKSKLGKPVQFAVDNSMLIKGFDFRLDRGLMYTTVTFTRKVLSLLVTVDNSQITFDRIPIQEYLRKVSEEK